MEILDGKKISEEIQAYLRMQVEKVLASGNKEPHLAAVLVGEDPASETYVNMKVKTCDKIGYKSTMKKFDLDITEEQLLQVVEELNEDDDVDGILVQLPLPGHISTNKIIESIDSHKDVDGFHPLNIGKMNKGLHGYIPATPLGILLLMEKYQIETQGRHCVIVGRSQIVGLPMSILMQRNAYPGNCTVTLCHRYTENMAEITRQADILISAVGKPGLIKADMVKEGAVVIDVGTTRVDAPEKKKGFKLKGDVDYEAVSPKCSYITPVPGGVGPMTIAGLMSNTIKAAKEHFHRKSSSA